MTSSRSGGHEALKFSPNSVMEKNNEEEPEYSLFLFQLGLSDESEKDLGGKSGFDDITGGVISGSTS